MTLSTLEFLVEAPFNLLDIDIPQDADWTDPFQIVIADGEPMDLSDVLLELYIRPTYNHATLLKKFTSAGGSTGIVIDDPTQGMAYFSVDRTLIAEIPIGAWQQFFVMTEGTLQTELWRGSMRVHPGKF